MHFNLTKSKIYNTYAVQQDTQSFFFMIEFYLSHMLARHVLDFTGPSSGAFVYKLYVQVWYAVIRVLLHTKSALTARTCRANICDEQNSIIK